MTTSYRLSGPEEHAGGVLMSCHPPQDNLCNEKRKKVILMGFSLEAWGEPRSSEVLGGLT